MISCYMHKSLVGENSLYIAGDLEGIRSEEIEELEDDEMPSMLLIIHCLANYCAPVCIFTSDLRKSKL